MATKRILRTPSPQNPKIIFDTQLEAENKKYGDDFNGVTIGLCAMNCKSCSGPMKQILGRIATNNVRVVIFSDNTITNTPVHLWPSCDAFIAFYSKDFPLEKAIEYVKLRKPSLVINDLEMQYSLLDRREVYHILQENDIDVPKYYVVNRDKGEDVVEMDDTIDIKGSTLSKPFVEKPVSAEDHSVYVYFPSDYGGGSQRLFRKIKDRSSNYSKESTIRKKGSYIYEEFLATDGTDVKVYTVGPDYAHAEARKSPTLDGRVDRNSAGKEKRYPVILTAKEKLIARKVCLAFKQTVCGFDMLRTNGKSYVCDVNGFSFVKTSEKYYDDCGQILLETILSKIAPHLFPSIAPTVEYLAPEVPVPIPSQKNRLQLRCVIGVIRHSDRTPKQKMKMIVKDHEFLELFEKLGGYRKGRLKLKKPKELQRVLDISCELLKKLDEDDSEFAQKLHKLNQLKNVLQMYRSFSGINRKVQFKLITRSNDGTEFTEPVLLLILKWGGELTASGEMCAEELGKAFRCMYPGGEGEYSSLPGSGFLRLHSTYRHDLKVYASDEGRVQLTAAAFTKGMLDLEGNVASIVVHLVKRDESATNMLDTSTDATDALHNVKRELHRYMQSKDDLTCDRINKIAPTQSPPLLNALNSITNPHSACVQLHQEITLLVDRLVELSEDVETEDVLYQGESIQVMINRWKKLKKDFKMDNGKYDISKIPDIYDCAKFDLQHNRTHIYAEVVPLYKSAIRLADIVIPQEYGITVGQKLDISKKICSSLMKKIRSDIRHTYSDGDPDVSHRLDPEKSEGVISPKRSVRTRLYFTSESLIHSLVNMLKYGDLLKNSTSDPETKKNQEKFNSFPEWNYLSQIVLMVFEDISKPPGEGLQVNIHVSPGVKTREINEDNGMYPESLSADLPIVIHPNSNRFKRRSKDTLLSDNHELPKRNLSADAIVHNIDIVDSTLQIDITDSTLDKDIVIDPSKSDHVTPRKIRVVKSDTNLHVNDIHEEHSEGNKVRDSSVERKMQQLDGNYISLVSVVEPLIQICSLPVKIAESSLLVGLDDD